MSDPTPFQDLELPPEVPGSEGVSVVERRRSAVRAATEQLRRVVPFVERVARGIRLLALVTLAGGAAIWWWLADRGSREQTRTMNLAIWAVVLVSAPAILLVLSLALHQMARLPDRLRELPDRAGAHAAELRRLAEETRRVRERGGYGPPGRSSASGGGRRPLGNCWIWPHPRRSSSRR